MLTNTAATGRANLCMATRVRSMGAERIVIVGGLGNQRQTENWERDALRDLRHGDIPAALRAYRQHDRLHTHPDHDQLRASIAERYAAAIGSGTSPFDVTALTASRAGATALNADIRAALQDAGRLGADQAVGDRSYAVGELVIVTRNDYPRGLLNGTRAVIADITDRHLTLQLEDRRTVDVPPGWAAERLRTAYAMTVHKAQGLTVDVALVDASGLRDRNSGYVALSRARTRTEIHTDTDGLTHSLGNDPLTPRRAAPDDRAALLAQRLQRRSRRALAIDQLPRNHRIPRPTPERQFHRDHGRGLSR